MGEEDLKITADEVGELVKEYELLGSREAREEAVEYMRFLREELVRGPSSEVRGEGAVRGRSLNCGESPGGIFPGSTS